MEKEHGKKSHYLKEQERLMDQIRELGSLPSTAYTMFRDTAQADLLKKLSQARAAVALCCPRTIARIACAQRPAQGATPLHVCICLGLKALVSRPCTHWRCDA